MSTDDKDSPRLTPEQYEQLRETLARVTSAARGIEIPKFSMPALDLPKFDSPALASVARAIAASHKFDFDVSKSLQENLPRFKLDLPPLGLNYERLLGPAINLENLGNKHAIDIPSLKLFDKIYEDQRERFSKIFEDFRKIADSILLPNWRGIESFDQFETLLLDEGLPVAWVPPSDTLTLLLAAPSPQARRAIVGRRWKGLARASFEVIDSCSNTDYRGYREFALEVVKLLTDGYPAGAQALAANLLDTMLQETLDDSARRLVTDQKTRISIDDLPLRAAMVFGGIWGSHTRFWKAQGDAIPRRFTRHATVHGVSKRQYSRVNAVIAMMHVTAYLKLLDTGELA